MVLNRPCWSSLGFTSAAFMAVGEPARQLLESVGRRLRRRHEAVENIVFVFAQARLREGRHVGQRLDPRLGDAVTSPRSVPDFRCPTTVG